MTKREKPHGGKVQVSTITNGRTPIYAVCIQRRLRGQTMGAVTFRLDQARFVVDALNDFLAEAARER